MPEVVASRAARGRSSPRRVVARMSSPPMSETASAGSAARRARPSSRSAALMPLQAHTATPWRASSAAAASSVLSGLTAAMDTCAPARTSGNRTSGVSAATCWKQADRASGQIERRDTVPDPMEHRATDTAPRSLAGCPPLGQRVIPDARLHDRSPPFGMVRQPRKPFNGAARRKAMVDESLVQGPMSHNCGQCGSVPPYALRTYPATRAPWEGSW